MGPLAATKSALGKYITFKGRASRSEFTWFFLFMTGAIFGGMFYELPNFIHYINIPTDAIGRRALIENTSIKDIAAFFPITGSIILFLLLPSITVSVRRLHDFNWPGFLYLVTFIPVVGPLFTIALTIVPSTEGENKYGPSPFDPSAPAPVKKKKPKVVKVPKTGPRFARASKPKKGKTKYADLVRPRAPHHTGPMRHAAE